MSRNIPSQAFFSLCLVFTLCISTHAADSIQLAGVAPETMQEMLLFYDVDELLSVSFFDTVTRKAPGNSYIITADQIENSPARTLNDVIAMRVAGMTTGGHERHGPIIGTRGIFIDNNAKTMVMLDEQQINKRSHFGYTSGLLSPLLGDIKQVEVILGPGAILHGSGALNGFINMIPKNGEDNPGWFVGSEYGVPEELWKLEMGYGTAYGEDKNIYLYGGAYGAEGTEPDELYGYTKTFDIHAGGFAGGNYRTSLYWNHKGFNLNAFYFEDNPYKFGTAEVNHMHQTTLGIRPKYLFQINDTDSLELTGSFLWGDHMSPGAHKGQITDKGGSESHWESKNIFRTTRWQDHALALGFSVGEKRFYEKDQFFSEDAGAGLESVGTKWLETSSFVEDVFELNDNWVVSFGLRYDTIDLNEMTYGLWRELHASDPGNPNKKAYREAEPIDGHFSPRIATAYDLDKETTIKASYQHGFRTPDAAYYMWYLTYKDAAESLGLEFPTLETETLDSYELNFLKEIPDKKIKFSCNLFYNRYKDLLSFKYYKDIALYTPAEIQAIRAVTGVPFPHIGSFMNETESLTAKGGEISVVLQPLRNHELRVSYGYVESNAAPVRFPKHQVKLETLSSFMNDKMNLSLNYLYNSSYSASDLPSAHEIYRKDRHVVNMALNYRITKDVRIGLSVHNLFATDVPPMVFEPDRLDRGGIGYDERRVYVSLKTQL